MSLLFMQRCIELAETGAGFTAPNPLVGAVLVHDNKIIGEGYHELFGAAHAEVNAINSVIKDGNEHLLNKSTLYVNLEPCSHHGKTPPCTDLIIKHNIPQIRIGCKDPFVEVSGKGISILKNEGRDVETGILEKECLELNRRFIKFHTAERPYVVLKFARTANNFLAPLNNADKKISNEYTDRLVHKWRSEEASIMVGTRTAEADDPQLNVRKWRGKNPIRILIDRNLRLPSGLNMLDNKSSTIIFNEKKDGIENRNHYIRIDFSSLVSNILSALYRLNVLSVLIEGGTNLLTQFIDLEFWDEARIITASKIYPDGIQAPIVTGNIFKEENIMGDHIMYIRK